MIIRYLSLLLLSLFAIAAIAAEQAFPPLCAPIVVKGLSIELGTKKPSLVLIHNHSNAKLWLSHPSEREELNAGWASELAADKWSALVLDKDNFVLNCIESKPGHEQEVPCQGLVSVCSWSDIGLPSASKGSYWAAEGLDLTILETHLSDKGFKLPANLN